MSLTDKLKFPEQIISPSEQTLLEQWRANHKLILDYLKEKNIFLIENNTVLKNNLVSLEKDLEAFDKIHKIGYTNTTTFEKLDNNTPKEVVDENYVVKEIDPSIWLHYNSQGFIKTDCLTDAKLVQGPEETKIVIATSNLEEQQVKLLIDGTNLGTFSLKEGVLGTAFVNLEQGTHYLDLVYSDEGEFSLDLIRLGDRTISVGFLFDKGLAFNAFDCKDTSNTNVMQEPGAIRFKIEKV